MRATANPIQKLQTIIRTTPTITMIPPSVIPRICGQPCLLLPSARRTRRGGTWLYDHARQTRHSRSGGQAASGEV